MKSAVQSCHTPFFSSCLGGHDKERI